MSTVIDFERRSVALGVSLDDLIEAAGARLTDRIIIAGVHHLELLISLTRRGFLSVTCQSPRRSPHVPNSKADVILAPAIRSDRDLLDLLDGLGNELRPGGTLFVQVEPGALVADLPLRPALRAHGLDSFTPVAGPSGALLWRAQKQAAALVRAA